MAFDTIKTKNAPLKKNQRVTMGDFIFTVPNNLDKDFCQHCIDKFDKDPNVAPGMVGAIRRIDRETKTSDDLYISQDPNWQDEDKVFYTSLQRGLEEWGEVYTGKDSGYFWNVPACQDSGYQIQRTEPGGFYHWHMDWNMEEGAGARIITFIWYLNDVKEDGYTEFVDGTKIQPECGKLLMFPSTWTYGHRGFPPKNEVKYIATGWLHDNFYQKNTRLPETP